MENPTNGIGIPRVIKIYHCNDCSNIDLERTTRNYHWWCKLHDRDIAITDLEDEFIEIPVWCELDKLEEGGE